MFGGIIGQRENGEDVKWLTVREGDIRRVFGFKADIDFWAYLEFFVSMIASVGVAMNWQDMR
jgi:hypothetical protein